jgi:hypothetical protein
MTSSQLELQPLHLGEGIRREGVDSAELHGQET